jgi:hypothetical protein
MHMQRSSAHCSQLPVTGRTTPQGPCPATAPSRRSTSTAGKLGPVGAQALLDALEAGNFTLCDFEGVVGADGVLKRNQLIVHNRRLRVRGSFLCMCECVLYVCM